MSDLEARYTEKAGKAMAEAADRELQRKARLIEEFAKRLLTEGGRND